MTLEELMNVRVVSVSRQQKTLENSAAAVYVITREEIVASGAGSVPELLRRVPGLDVAQVTTGEWMVSARGFSGLYANKLLVMIDGRSVYTTLYSGVYWDQSMVPLDEIERIEVIRGPGGTMWGANAVNGVINIITRSSRDTKGGLASWSFGNREQTDATLRYGGDVGTSFHYRVYSSYVDRTPLEDQIPQSRSSGNQLGQVGARADWDLSPRDSLLVEIGGTNQQGAQGYNSGPPLGSDRVRVSGDSEYALAKWHRDVTTRQSFDLQISGVRQIRGELGGSFSAHIIDVDFQHQFALGARNNLVYGVGFRDVSDNIHPGTVSGGATILPPHRNDRVSSGFVQDEFAFIPDKLAFTLGVKVEHNDYTGWEFGPSARLAWTPTPRAAFWAAVSRAVRTPNRTEFGVVYSQPAPPPLPPGSLELLTGSPNFRSETVNAFEAGYRKQFGERTSLDLAVFGNRYQYLRSYAPGAPQFTATGLILPITFGNGVHADSAGIELSAARQVTRRWKIDGSYSWFHLNEYDLGITPSNDTSPHHQIKIHSGWTLSPRLSADVDAFCLSRLPAFPIPSSFRLNTHVQWRFTSRLDLDLTLSNLTDQTGIQFQPEDNILPMLDRPSAQLKLSWKF
jgi:iron complex outermembrane recepter protein